ncbi:LytTR family DNA-binding domain-containing protein [Enterococcus cecorum]|uniref:LytR/AlgR family response regulator transcription factor n=1 Tax=Enterococcus cecorum TaxID=44008 RepID=UPI001FAB6FFD|nr:LytTR family DNA-binding domain-containing protein [Enterococcus cecorum]MCJ0570490.1 LytTR family DNA-binding domain-containing protein [Enterococcus cecorum]
MYKIAICDDEISQTNQIEELLLKLFLFLDKTVEIDIFYTPESLINNVTKQGSVYQIIFLDIEMGKLDGVETARILREYDRDFILVFITSYTSYMLSSFEVKPFRYVLKPLQTEEFTKLIKDINQELDDRNAYLFYRSGRDKYQLTVSYKHLTLPTN